MQFTLGDFKRLYLETYEREFNPKDYNTGALTIKEGKFDNGDRLGMDLIKKLLVAYIPDLPEDKQLHFMLLEDNDITCGGSNYHEVLNAYNALQ